MKAIQTINGVTVEVEIQENSKRSHLTTFKIRCLHDKQ